MNSVIVIIAAAAITIAAAAADDDDLFASCTANTVACSRAHVLRVTLCTDGVGSHFQNGEGFLHVHVLLNHRLQHPHQFFIGEIPMSNLRPQLYHELRVIEVWHAASVGDRDGELGSDGRRAVA